MARPKGSTNKKTAKRPVTRKKGGLALAKGGEEETATKPGSKRGHNSGINQPLVELFTEALSIQEKQKALGKALRDVRNKAKTEHGVLSAVFMHELKLKKMDRDFRIQFESGHQDLKQALGYQLSLDLNSDTTARTEDEYVDPSRRLRDGDAHDDDEDPSAVADRLTGRGA